MSRAASTARGGRVVELIFFELSDITAEFKQKKNCTNLNFEKNDCIQIVDLTQLLFRLK